VSSQNINGNTHCY